MINRVGVLSGEVVLPEPNSKPCTIFCRHPVQSAMPRFKRIGLTNSNLSHSSSNLSYQRLPEVAPTGELGDVNRGRAATTCPHSLGTARVGAGTRLRFHTINALFYSELPLNHCQQPKQMWDFHHGSMVLRSQLM